MTTSNVANGDHTFRETSAAKSRILAGVGGAIGGIAGFLLSGCAGVLNLNADTRIFGLLLAALLIAGACLGAGKWPRASIIASLTIVILMVVRVLIGVNTVLVTIDFAGVLTLGATSALSAGLVAALLATALMMMRRRAQSSTLDR